MGLPLGKVARWHIKLGETRTGAQGYSPSPPGKLKSARQLYLFDLILILGRT